MIFYHFKELADYFRYLEPGQWTFFDLDVEEVDTKYGLDFYAILTAYSTDKERVYVCVHKLGSMYGTHAQAAVTHLGKKDDPAYQKKVEAFVKAEELRKKQRKDELVKEFKKQAARLYKEAEFSEFERRWSTAPLVHLPASVEPEAAEAEEGGKAGSSQKPGGDEADEAGGAAKDAD